MKTKRIMAALLILMLIAVLASCASAPKDRYNTQKGAAIGAGAGAIGGQIIGGNTEGTLIGAAVGTLVGAVLGNAVDQREAALREAALEGERVAYYDDDGGIVEVEPGPVDRRTDCRKVTKREWNKGELVKETIEEICEGEKSSRDY
jgi:hypothetical protein